MLIVDNIAGFLLILAAAFILIITVQVQDINQEIIYAESMQEIGSQELLNHFAQRMANGKTMMQFISEGQDDLVLQEAQAFFEQKLSGKNWKFVIAGENRLASETSSSLQNKALLLSEKTAHIYVPVTEGVVELYILEGKAGDKYALYGFQGMRSIG